MLSVGKRAMFGLLAVALVATLGGCATESPKLWSYSEEAEAEQGLRQHEALVAQLGICPNEDLSRYVAEVGGRLATASERPGLKWQFTVLDSPKPHAFATRGGHVYITRGMLARLRSESDLAAVLAHEISHISTRDEPRAEVRGNTLDAGKSAAAAAFPFETFIVEPYTRSLASLGALELSRQEEFDADRRAAENLRRAGYPEESMSAMLEMLASTEARDRDYDAPSLDGRYEIFADQYNSMSFWGGMIADIETSNRERDRRFPTGRHGIFANYPSPEIRKAKLDQALQGRGFLGVLLGHHVGNKEASVQASAPAAADPAFLARLNGLEFGSGKSGIPSADGKRYFPELNLMVGVPSGWVASVNPPRLWIGHQQSGTRMSIQRVARTTADLCEALEAFAEGASITERKRASHNGVRSCTGSSGRSLWHAPVWHVGIVARDDDPNVRYVFRGWRSMPRASGYAGAHDPLLIAIAQSVESLHENDARPKPTVLRIHRVQEGDTFASLAKTARVPDAETTLRVLNHRYPNGELEVGQLVKVIE
jgi:predicted Zn-dependent protease